MQITGVGTGGNSYPFTVNQTETVKGEAIPARPSQTDTVSISKPDGATYYETLRQKFPCVKNGGVTIAGAYLDRCAKNPDMAKKLEENLAAFNDCVQRGYQSAKNAAQAAGGKLLSYAETWNIDSEGTLTMISHGTAEYETGIKSWEDIRKEPLAHTEKAREEQDTQEPLAGAEEESEDISERRSSKVAVNEGKRARQIAAAKSRDQVQQVIALLHKDMADCKAGLENGWCDEAEIAKVQALLSAAQARLSQVPQEAEQDLGISAFDLAGLL